MDQTPLNIKGRAKHQREKTKTKWFSWPCYRAAKILLTEIHTAYLVRVEFYFQKRWKSTNWWSEKGNIFGHLWYLIQELQIFLLTRWPSGLFWCHDDLSTTIYWSTTLPALLKCRHHVPFASARRQISNVEDSVSVLGPSLQLEAALSMQHVPSVLTVFVNHPHTRSMARGLHFGCRLTRSTS